LPWEVESCNSDEKVMLEIEQFNGKSANAAAVGCSRLERVKKV